MNTNLLLSASHILTYVIPYPNPSTTPRSYPILKRKVRREADMPVMNEVFTAKECNTGPGQTTSSYASPSPWPSPPPKLCTSLGRAIYVSGPEHPRLGSKFSGQALGSCCERVFLEHTGGKRRPTGEGHGTGLAGPTNTKTGSFHQETCPLTSGLEESGLPYRGADRAAWDSAALPGPGKAGRIGPRSGTHLTPETACLCV